MEDTDVVEEIEGLAEDVGVAEGVWVSDIVAEVVEEGEGLVEVDGVPDMVAEGV